jgi:hypothetical protein
LNKLVFCKEHQLCSAAVRRILFQNWSSEVEVSL